jgi:Na+(H+)/acetate symporter ActP
MDRLAPRLQIAVGIASVVAAVLILGLWFSRDTPWGQWTDALAGATWVLLAYIGLRTLQRGIERLYR